MAGHFVPDIHRVLPDAGLDAAYWHPPLTRPGGGVGADVAARPTDGCRLDRLAVDDAGSGLLVSPLAPPVPLSKGHVELLPGPIQPTSHLSRGGSVPELGVVSSRRLANTSKQ
jgi:hypothetical protein